MANEELSNSIFRCIFGHTILNESHFRPTKPSCRHSPIMNEIPDQVNTQIGKIVFNEYGNPDISCTGAKWLKIHKFIVNSVTKENIIMHKNNYYFITTGAKLINETEHQTDHGILKFDSDTGTVVPESEFGRYLLEHDLRNPTETTLSHFKFDYRNDYWTLKPENQTTTGTTAQQPTSLTSTGNSSGNPTPTPSRNNSNSTSFEIPINLTAFSGNPTPTPSRNNSNSASSEIPINLTAFSGNPTSTSSGNIFSTSFSTNSSNPSQSSNIINLTKPEGHQELDENPNQENITEESEDSNLKEINIPKISDTSNTYTCNSEVKRLINNLWSDFETGLEKCHQIEQKNEKINQKLIKEEKYLNAMDNETQIHTHMFEKAGEVIYNLEMLFSFLDHELQNIEIQISESENCEKTATELQSLYQKSIELNNILNTLSQTSSAAQASLNASQTSHNMF